MIRSLISTCLSRRPLVLIGFLAFVAIGFGAFRAMNIEAYPDPAPPIIEIIAQYPGQSPEEVERYVTIPIEIAVASTPGLKYIRIIGRDPPFSTVSASRPCNAWMSLATRPVQPV